MMVRGWKLAAVVVMAVGYGAWAQDTHWGIQAVDGDGHAIHYKVGGAHTDPANRVVLEGIALNGPGEIVDTSCEFLLTVQGEGDDHAGTQLWSACYFQDWPGPYAPYFNIQPGDRVRVEGYCMEFVGKVNMNERHSDDPGLDFTVTILDHPGMPAPEVIPSVADCNYFDFTRTSGGEWYQSRWVQLNGVELVSGTWAAGQTVVVSDGTGQLNLKLASVGDFGSFPAPSGPFNVIGIFDQEPDPLDFAASRKEHYRIWVKRQEHIIPAATAPTITAAVSRKTHGLAGDFDIDVLASGAVECRGQGPSELRISFDQPIQLAGGIDPLDTVTLSSGQVDSVSVNGAQLLIEVSGTSDAANLEVSLPGIESLGGLAATDTLCFGVLAGDIRSLGNLDPDGVTNVFDMLLIKANLNQAANAGNFRGDLRGLAGVEPDGTINVFDALTIKANLNQAIAQPCP